LDVPRYVTRRSMSHSSGNADESFLIPSRDESTDPATASDGTRGDGFAPTDGGAMGAKDGSPSPSSRSTGGLTRHFSVGLGGIEPPTSALSESQHEPNPCYQGYEGSGFYAQTSRLALMD